MSFCELNYFEHSSDEWPSLLKLAKAKNRHLVTNIPWSLHERARGQYDFSKRQNLRIEEFLQDLTKLDMTVSFRFGFHLGPQSIPQWIFEGDGNTVVPASSWFTRDWGLALTRVPSIHLEPMKSAYQEFVCECLARLSLYQIPHGPISYFEFMPGVYGSDLTPFHSQLFGDYFSKKNPDEATLNARYGAHFRQCNPSDIKQHHRLQELRPWIYAHDLKWCRNLANKDYFSSLAGITGCKEHSPSHGASPSRALYYMDSTLFETTPDGPIPIQPGPTLTTDNVFFKHVWSLYQEVCGDSTVTWMEPSVSTLSEESSLRFLTCTKFLALEHANFFMNYLNAGGNLFCTFQVPAYDENLNSLALINRNIQKIPKTQIKEANQKEKGKIFLVSE